MPVKIIHFNTNYNHKLDCDKFIHIDLAPENGIPESKAEATIIEIHTLDKTHEPVQVKLAALTRLPFQDLQDIITWTSHGMSTDRFKQVMQRSNEKIKPDTPMAIYFYQKLINAV